MARTSYKYVNFITKSGGALRALPLVGLSVVGITYDEQDLTAWQDAIKTSLPTMPDAPIEATFLWTTDAAAALPTLSGSHTVLAGLCGALTPLTVDIQFGIVAAWTAGSPQFGITASATDGYLLYKYQVDPANMTCSTLWKLFAGSAAPAWNTTAET